MSDDGMNGSRVARPGGGRVIHGPVDNVPLDEGPVDDRLLDQPEADWPEADWPEADWPEADRPEVDSEGRPPRQADRAPSTTGGLIPRSLLDFLR